MATGQAKQNRCREDDERPRAYIIKKAGSSVTREEILKFLDSRVAKIKRITGGIVFTDEIPKNQVTKALQLMDAKLT